MIPYGRQQITDEDIQSVVEVLKSDFITQGPAVVQFEQSVVQWCGAEFACAVNSATSALHLACLALGVGEADWLWTTPNTFVASANCGLYCGARVDFVDIDPQTYNLCATQLEQKLVKAQQEGVLPKVVVPVHFAGQSCDIKRIHELSQQYGFKVIEDASHAIGGLYQGQPIGNGRYSDITVFSFHPVKIVTTGEGGMAVTNDAALGNKMSLLRSHGVTRDTGLMTRNDEGPWYYQQVDLGLNYRMTDIQAALGVSQMTRLESFIEKRHHIAQRYDEMLKDIAVTTPFQSADSHSAYHLYPVRVNDELRRRDVFEHLRANGIGVNVHYIPVHTQPWYEQMGFRKGDFPHAEHYYAGAISLPMYPDLTEDDQDYVVKTLKDALQ